MKKFLLLLLCLTTFFSFSQSNCNFTNSNATQQCVNGGQALITFEWFNDTTITAGCDVVSVSYSNEDGVGPFVYPIGYPSGQPFGNFGVFAGVQNMPPNWSVEHYLVLNYSNGTQSDTIVYTPTACIPGCMDTNSIAYNPWATNNDSSCVGGGGNSGCNPGDHEITIEVTLDSYPGETSWILVDMSNGNQLENNPQGTYDFNDIGQTYSYTVCIDPAGAELIFNDSYGDGLAGSTTGGTVDGDITIYDCNGSVLWIIFELISI